MQQSKYSKKHDKERGTGVQHKSQEKKVQHKLATVRSHVRSFHLSLPHLHIEWATSYSTKVWHSHLTSPCPTYT